MNSFAILSTACGLERFASPSWVDQARKVHPSGKLLVQCLRGYANSGASVSPKTVLNIAAKLRLTFRQRQILKDAARTGQKLQLRLRHESSANEYRMIYEQLDFAIKNGGSGATATIV